MKENTINIITQANDAVSNTVCEYLLGKKIHFNRINDDDFYPVTFTVKTINNKLKIWDRRGSVNTIPDAIDDYQLLYFLQKDRDSLAKAYERIHKEESKYIGDYEEERQSNKIYDLFLAQKVGLNIPDSIITNVKKDLSSFFSKHKLIITKSITLYPKVFYDDKEYSSNKTVIVSQDQIDNLNEAFATSLFQQYIGKKIEIRVFYFEGLFFSMAIFSQNDKKTEIDFRNYNYEKPNRNTPFKLPKEIENKLKKFIKIKKINSCSIDLIMTPRNEFVFLEINPQGQFEWVSAYCNYYIEKKIANHISKK
ncbi:MULTISPECIES: ATP-grasp domain-containing protein [Chryseobacterium]|uniref:RimK-like ATP-grasp domain-containing protein n=1 Tax=Chryseobacterium taihuense TaxID=1141221 RepID=A0ABY0QQB6_9FLAO|nr:MULTISPECIES: hypothetical protein [Chryseobacterium]SDL47524.1 RimK-like ATP-grasp domain-containing protein [Chryseobacterium taihuense]